MQGRDDFAQAFTFEVLLLEDAEEFPQAGEVKVKQFGIQRRQSCPLDPAAVDDEFGK